MLLALGTLQELKTQIRLEAASLMGGGVARPMFGFRVLYFCSSVCHLRFASRSRYPEYHYFLIYHFYEIFLERVDAGRPAAIATRRTWLWHLFLWLNRRLSSRGWLAPAIGAAIGAYAHIRWDLGDGIGRALVDFRAHYRAPVDDSEIAGHLFDHRMRRVFAATLRHFLRFPERIGRAGHRFIPLGRSISWIIHVAKHGVPVIQGWRRSAWRDFISHREGLREDFYAR